MEKRGEKGGGGEKVFGTGRRGVQDVWEVCECSARRKEEEEGDGGGDVNVWVCLNKQQKLL